MGLRFDLSVANWIAHLIQPGVPIPRLSDERTERETIRHFLKKLNENFYSNSVGKREFKAQVRNALESVSSKWGEISPSELLKPVRDFMQNRPWTALIIPSGRVQDRALDEHLCSRDLLQAIVKIRPGDPGLILQLEAPPEPTFSLMDVFPAFRTALAHNTQWPGILLWTSSGDSVFLPLPRSRTKIAIDKAINWIFSHLAVSKFHELELLETQYKAENLEAYSTAPPVHIIHISDLHLGSREAFVRLPRVQQLIRNLVSDLGERSTLIPVITGDIMESPDEENLDAVRNFMDFATNLGTDTPIVVLGNHDVRKGGILGDDFRAALQLPGMSYQVRWCGNLKLAFVCFNSVISGNLARGYVGERQFIDIGNEIDRKKDQEAYTKVAVLHHHPIPVKEPAWYQKPFYERILGSIFPKTEELKDSKAFVKFVENRGVAAVLHGHKHIPRVDHTAGKRIQIIGCGSSVGKVLTKDKGTYMSINVISMDPLTNNPTCRLLAERIVGGGLSEDKHHEIISKG